MRLLAPPPSPRSPGQLALLRLVLGFFSNFLSDFLSPSKIMHVANLCLGASLYSYFQHPGSLYNPDLASLYIGRIHFFSLLDWASYGLLALFRGACRWEALLERGSTGVTP